MDNVMDIPKEVNNSNLFGYKILAALSVGAFFVWFFISNTPKIDKQSINISTVEKADFPVHVQAFGKIKPSLTVVLTAPIESIVSKVHKRSGESVKEGELIVSLSSQSLRNRLIDVQKKLDIKQSDLDEYIIQTQIDNIDIISEIESLESEYTLMKTKQSSEEQLSNSGIISKISLLETQLSVQKIENKIRTLKNKQDELAKIHQLKKRSMTLSQQNIQAELFLLKEYEQQLSVKAPMAGTLQKIDIEVGETASPDTKLGLVSSNDQLKVFLSVPQRELHKIKNGMAVAFQHLGEDKQSYTGQVSRIDSAIEEGYGLVESTINLDINHQLTLQQDIKAEIQTGILSSANIVRIPHGIKPNSHSSIYVYKDTLATKTNVTFGESNNKYVVIKSGLKQGDRIITSDTDHLFTAQQVEIN
jgi:HlyD family secretion protein